MNIDTDDKLSPINIWTLVHACSGFLIRILFKVNLYTVVVLSLLFEIIENTDFGIQWFVDNGFTNYRGDSFSNAIVDTLAMIAGYYVAVRVEAY